MLCRAKRLPGTSLEDAANNNLEDAAVSINYEDTLPQMHNISMSGRQIDNSKKYLCQDLAEQD